MHKTRVDHREPKAADRGLDELWAADELIGYTLVLDSDLMLGIESRHDRTASPAANAMTKLISHQSTDLGRGKAVAPLNGTLVVRSRVAWLTSPPLGRASVGVGSHAFSALPLSIATNEPAPGETTPSELLAAAHGSALAVILARMLEDFGAAARELVIETTYELRGDWYEVDRITFDVQARFSNGADPPLDQLANAALDRCAQSLGLVREKTAVRVSRHGT